MIASGIPFPKRMYGGQSGDLIFITEKQKAQEKGDHSQREAANKMFLKALEKCRKISEKVISLTELRQPACQVDKIQEKKQIIKHPHNIQGSIKNNNMPHRIKRGSIGGGHKTEGKAAYQSGEGEVKCNSV